MSTLKKKADSSTCLRAYRQLVPPPPRPHRCCHHRHICPHNYCVCVLILLYVSSYYCICVLILQYVCPHASVCVSSYYCQASGRPLCSRMLTHAHVCSRMLTYAGMPAVLVWRLVAWSGCCRCCRCGCCRGEELRIVYRGICVY